MPGVITSCCGSFGRFGNAMFQYAVARAYAESIGAEFKTGYWIGRQLFEGVNEPMAYGQELPHLEGEVLDGSTNVHLHGYFQRPEHVKLLSRAKLKEWFKPKANWVQPQQELIIHKRRGDYIAAGCYALVSDKSYDDALAKFGFDPLNAYILSDDRSQDHAYTDFFGMVACRNLFRANSSFSWWAATLSEARVFSPVVEDKTGWIDCEFVEGNHSRMFYLFGDLHLGE